jgi:hypothetical protein
MSTKQQTHLQAGWFQQSCKQPAHSPLLLELVLLFAPPPHLLET